MFLSQHEICLFNHHIYGRLSTAFSAPYEDKESTHHALLLSHIFIVERVAMSLIARHKYTILLLFLLTSVAYGLRVIGAGTSIAYIHDTQLVRQAMEVGQRLATSQDFDTGFREAFKYPLTLTYYLAGLVGVFFVGGQTTGVFASLSEFQDYLFANRTMIHLIGVYGFNVISVLLIPALYLASRNSKMGHTGWLAAGLGAFNLLLIHFGQQPRPHVPLATLSFIAVFLLVLVVQRRGGWWVALAATVASALTVGTLQNGIVIALPFALAWLLRPYHAGKYQVNQLWHPMIIVNGLLFVSLSVLLHPQLVTEYLPAIWQLLTGTATSARLGGGTHFVSASMFSFDHVPQFINNIGSYQPLLTLALPIAIPYWIYQQRHKPRLLLVAISFPLINLIVWSLFSGRLICKVSANRQFCE